MVSDWAEVFRQHLLGVDHDSLAQTAHVCSGPMLQGLLHRGSLPESSWIHCAFDFQLNAGHRVFGNFTVVMSVMQLHGGERSMA